MRRCAGDNTIRQGNAGSEGLRWMSGSGNSGTFWPPNTTTGHFVIPGALIVLPVEEPLHA